ncbi:Zn-dependent oligopeptidase [Actinocatenispora thailandica]|uniref:Zn-dependent oligopeptidase n=1 Tax=Actinocatenispora thailandica TaxID=227318 RepID=A0A7R7HWB8_9ACTN|nr:M3 family metallopeptidase [Actinocatenispora thailandica]BCJ34927.1 Zn-dependent oligopeptidase [Actinocatenispora thailandica]
MQTTTTPDPLPLPAADADWAAFVRRRAADNLAAARAGVEQLAGGAPGPATDRDPAEVLARWNDIAIAIDNVAQLGELLAQTHPDEAVRTVAETCQQDADRLATEIGLDPRLYRVLAAVDADALDAAGRRVLERSLRDFRRAGVDQPDEVRDRLRALAEAQVRLGQRFDKNIRDDVRSIRIAPERLDGLPEDYRAAHPADADGQVTITTEYPDYQPFKTFATDAAARRALTVEFLNRAWPANDEVLAELLAVRAEQARLLGYADWADYDAEVKMVGSGSAIAGFIDRVVAEAQQPADRDRQVLLDRLRADDPTATGIDASDNVYYAEVVRRERFDVDATKVRRYFDFPAVRAGLLAVTGRLFGLEYREVPGAGSWHADVTSYDVYTGDQLLGRIHLDLHPRPGKFSHAAMFPLVSGIAGRQLPEGVLLCNFPRGLMEHSQVVTLFHEFGHLVHHVLAGRHDWVRFSGVATEWDFVEAPSQMLEEWAWDPEVLRSFARDETGEPIPTELVTRMRQANDFGKGYLARTQMFYASLSYLLHHEKVDDVTAFSRQLQRRVDAFDPIDGTHFHAGFGHLVGYTSAYYTYMWSLVIAKDMFSAFETGNLFDPEVAGRYRDLVLAAGGSDDAAVLVERFLGRPYTVDAFSAWLAR